MKPNILVIQPAQADADPAIDHLCETLAETHYVYLVRPLTVLREDSSSGVRFLNFSPDHLPGFGEVDTVIIVDGVELAGWIQAEYPDAHHWHVDSQAGDYFALPGAPPADTIIDGEFGQPIYQDCARAV